MLTFVVGNPPAFGTLSVVTMAPLLGDRQTGPNRLECSPRPNKLRTGPSLRRAINAQPRPPLPSNPVSARILAWVELVQHQAQLLRGRVEVWQESRPHILDRDALSVRPYIDCRDHSARGVSHRHGHRTQA